MKGRVASEAALKRIKELQKNLEASLKDISKQLRRADRGILGLKNSLNGFSKDKTQDRLVKFLAKSRKDLIAFQAKLEKQIETLKIQAKAITEAERAKRRARSRSK